MKSKEIRDLKLQEIEGRIKEETEQLDHLSFQHAIATLDNPMVLREKRRLLARLKTILAEKQTASA